MLLVVLLLTESDQVVTLTQSEDSEAYPSGLRCDLTLNPHDRAVCMCCHRHSLVGAFVYREVHFVICFGSSSKR
jgi:hypothetical protein